MSMKKIIFQPGDIIFQKKDQWVFLITKVTPNKVELNYWNPTANSMKEVIMERKKLRSYFTGENEDGQHLVHYKVL